GVFAIRSANIASRCAHSLGAGFPRGMTMDMMEATIEQHLQIDEPRGNADQEYYANARSYRSARAGPFAVPVRIRVRAYGVHVGNGGNTADLTLLKDGEAYGSAHDQNFNRSNLQVLNHTILDQGEKVTFAIESTNH